MSYHTNERNEIVTDEPTLMAAARLLGHVDASLAYTKTTDPEAIQAYLERLRKTAQELDKHLQLKQR